MGAVYIYKVVQIKKSIKYWTSYFEINVHPVVCTMVCIQIDKKELQEIQKSRGEI